MLFSSPDFLFAFLPVFFLLYFAAPFAARNLILFLASLFFYFTTSGELTVVLILSVLINHYLAQAMHTMRGGRKTALLTVGIAVNLAPLLYYKYATFFTTALNDAFAGLGFTFEAIVPHPLLPIGISFFTFQAISYIADIYMDRVKPAKKLVDFGMYHSCFPQLIAGPIVRYEEIAPQVTARTTRLDDLYEGALRFCYGLGKKVIFADTMGIVADKIFGMPDGTLGMATAWIGLLAYTLQIYFDFSGYSDMAIGLGRMMGFTYPENFNQPYRSKSVSEFWRRWHMTLSRWFRDYVYIPLGGNRAGASRTYFNLLIVFFLCGLWHGAAYTFILWGLWHGALLIAERMGSRWNFRIPAPAAWFYALLAVMLGWVLFRAPTLDSALAYYAALFGHSTGPQPLPLGAIMDAQKILFLLIALLVALFPFERLKAKTFHPLLLPVGGVAVFLFSVTLASVNGFSPFIYFRF